MSVPRPALAWRLLAHAALYAGGAAVVAPFAWMVLTALKTDAESIGANVRLLPAGPPASWRWSSFPRAWAEADLGRVYGNSLLVAVSVTLLATAHNALAGFAFAKLRFAGRRVAFAAVLATLLLPYQVWFIFAYVIAGSIGYVDHLHALVVPFLASAFGIFYMRQAISSVPDDVLDAGRLDGFADLDLFVHVVVPLVRPAVAALAIFTFTASWNDFFWPLVAIDSADRATLPLAVARLSSGLYVQSWPVQMAAATIITLPTILLFVVFQRSVVRGVELTGRGR